MARGQQYTHTPGVLGRQNGNVPRAGSPATCPLSEVLLYWKVSFGTQLLSAIRNSEVVVRYSGAENVLRLRE